MPYVCGYRAKAAQAGIAGVSAVLLTADAAPAGLQGDYRQVVQVGQAALPYAAQGILDACNLWGGAACRRRLPPRRPRSPAVGTRGTPARAGPRQRIP